MQWTKSVFVIQCLLISACLGDLDIERKEKFLNGFINYLNNLPNQPYTYDDGVIVNAQKAVSRIGFIFISALNRLS